jgi:adenosyl cobinamide kinase/adenosyl cobinamide phosphate guanylyltransferase
LITGGVRSGKSALAERWARQWGGDAVTYAATMAQRGDDPEMSRRIERHRAKRPSPWRTIEFDPDDLPAPASGVLLFDCLGVAVSRVLLAHEHAGEDAALDTVANAVETWLTFWRNWRGPVVVVSNEVGSGVVPAYPLGRWFRDAQGEANQRVAQAADCVVLTVAGLPLALKGQLPA